MAIHNCMTCSNCGQPCPLCGTCYCQWLKKSKSPSQGVWVKNDRIATICHLFHMFGDMCAANSPKALDLKAIERAKGTIFDANMMAISGETCKYIANYIDGLNARLGESQ